MGVRKLPVPSRAAAQLGMGHPRHGSPARGSRDRWWRPHPVRLRGRGGGSRRGRGRAGDPVPGVRRAELRIAGLPAEMQGFRVIQLTNLHIGRLFHADWASQVVNRANALNPDLMLIATTGNREYHFNGTAWMRELQVLRMRMPVNQHAVVPVGDAELVVAGVAECSPMQGRPMPSSTGHSVHWRPEAVPGAPSRREDGPSRPGGRPRCADCPSARS
jgi:hypothetical protein